MMTTTTKIIKRFDVNNV